MNADFNLRKDDVKHDPDDESLRSSYSHNYQLNLSNRFQYNFGSNSFIQKIENQVKYSIGKQESYTQWLINRPVSAYTNKDTVGIYEGWFVPGNFLAKEEIVGKPITLLANFHLSSRYFHTGKVNHLVKFGASYEFENNGGKGIVQDPDRPRWVGLNNQNDRPYAFTYNPAVQNFGLYVEDKADLLLWGKQWVNNIGLRADLQNGYLSWQPRLNSTYYINSNLQLNFAYGISSKAPSLAYRYPVPTWIDISLMELYGGPNTPSLYLVYTDKIIPDNAKLKPATTIQYETGIKYQHELFTVSLFGF